MIFVSIITIHIFICNFISNWLDLSCAAQTYVYQPQSIFNFYKDLQTLQEYSGVTWWTSLKKPVRVTDWQLLFLRESCPKGYRRVTSSFSNAITLMVVERSKVTLGAPLVIWSNVDGLSLEAVSTCRQEVNWSQFNTNVWGWAL